MLKSTWLKIWGDDTMSSVKILHCADIHIGAAESFLGARADSRRYETVLTFEKIIDTAVSAGADVVAIAGDLFDSNTADARFYRPVFEKMASVPDIKILFAAGNHDPLLSSSPFLKYEKPGNLYVFPENDSCITFDDIKLRAYGRSFGNIYMQGEQLFGITPPDDGYVNIMVLHGELTGDLSSQYNAVTAEFIKNSGMDYIALGHIHKRSELQKIGNTYFAYCGCPEGQGFDETGEKGVYVGTVGKSLCALEFVPLAKRRHFHIKTDVTGLASQAEIINKISEDIKNTAGSGWEENLYKIELAGGVKDGTAVNATEITARISEAVYYAKVKDSTVPALDIEQLASEISLKGLFVKNMLSRMENASEDEKEELAASLRLGLKAFDSEVAYSED